MAITLKQAFALNGTPDLDSFNDLIEQCKNTDYFSDSKPINHLSSWEGYWYSSGYIINVSLSKTSVSAAEETITATYTIKQNKSTGDVAVSGVKPAVTNSLGSVSDITSTNSSGVGTCKIKINSRGTTIGNERTGSVLVAYEGSSKTVNYKQAGNYVTSISASGATLSYANIFAGATSASATTSDGTVTYTYSSTSTGTSKPGSTYGTLTITNSYALSASQNGFTAVNSSTGALTATNSGTTTHTGRSSGTVTRTVTYTWTPKSPYDDAGVKTATSKPTATCKQNANSANAYYGDLTASASYGSKNASAGTISPTLTVKCYGYYTSGSKGAQATVSSSNYTIAATMTTGNGASITSSTGVITWEANTGSARTSNTATLKITTKSPYLNSSGSALTVSPTATSTQSADGISGYKDLVVSLSYANASPSTANVTVNPSLTVKATPIYVSGKSASQVTIQSSGYSVSYTESTASSYASVSSAGVITWNSNAGVTSDRTVGVTASVTCNSTYSSLTGSKAVTAKHTKDSIKTYGDVTASIGTGITAANGSATVSGAQTLTWNSGHTSNGTITYDITDQYIGTTSTATSGTNITRYSLSGTKLSHTTMGTNTGYDIVVVTATGQGSKTKTAQTSVYNGVASTEYGNYKTTISLANATPTCSSGTTTATIKTYRQARSKYTSGSYGSYGSDTLATVGTPTVSESVDWLSVGAVSNSSTGTYTATVTYNANSKNTNTREVTLKATANSVEGTVKLTQGKDSYTDSGGVTSTTYGNWGGGAISFNSTTALSAAADSRTVTIQPWSRTKTVSTTAKIRTWTCGGTETLAAASSNNSTEYYTGLIDMSCSSTYGTFDTSQFSGSESAKSVTLTKTTYGASPTSSTSWTIKATPKDTTIAATSKTISVTKNVLSTVVASVKSGTTPVPYTGGSVTLQCKATLTTGTFVVTPTWSISSGVATLSSTSAKNPTLTYSSNSSSERTTKVIATYKNTSSAELSVKQSAAPVGWTLPIDFYVQSTRGVSGAADCSFKCSGDAVLGSQSRQTFSFNSGLIREYYNTSGSFKESKLLNLASLNVTTNTTNFSDYHLDWGFALHASGGYGSSTSSTIQYKMYWQVEKYDGTIYDLMSTSYPKTSTNYVSVDYLTTNESQNQSSSPISIANGDRIRITIVI